MKMNEGYKEKQTNRQQVGHNSYHKRLYIFSQKKKKKRLYILNKLAVIAHRPNEIIKKAVENEKWWSSKQKCETHDQKFPT